jgi:hypothetical protein
MRRKPTYEVNNRVANHQVKDSWFAKQPSFATTLIRRCTGCGWGQDPHSFNAPWAEPQLFGGINFPASSHPSRFGEKTHVCHVGGN